jgi:hypothetical protein
LSAGGKPIEIESQSLDSKLTPFSNALILMRDKVPEIQGSTQEVAIDKCRRAAELVVNQNF